MPMTTGVADAAAGRVMGGVGEVTRVGGGLDAKPSTTVVTGDGVAFWVLLPAAGSCEASSPSANPRVMGVGGLST